MTRLVPVRPLCDVCLSSVATLFCVEHQCAICMQCINSLHAPEPKQQHNLSADNEAQTGILMSTQGKSNHMFVPPPRSDSVMPSMATEKKSSLGDFTPPQQPQNQQPLQPPLPQNLLHHLPPQNIPHLPQHLQPHLPQQLPSPVQQVTAAHYHHHHLNNNTASQAVTSHAPSGQFIPPPPKMSPETINGSSVDETLDGTGTGTSGDRASTPLRLLSKDSNAAQPSTNSVLPQAKSSSDNKSKNNSIVGPETAHRCILLSKVITSISFCDFCDWRPSSVYCEEDAATFCQKCDNFLHSGQNTCGHIRKPVASTVAERPISFLRHLESESSSSNSDAELDDGSIVEPPTSPPSSPLDINRSPEEFEWPGQGQLPMEFENFPEELYASQPVVVGRVATNVKLANVWKTLPPKPIKTTEKGTKRTRDQSDRGYSFKSNIGISETRSKTMRTSITGSDGKIDPPSSQANFNGSNEDDDPSLDGSNNSDEKNGATRGSESGSAGSNNNRSSCRSNGGGSGSGSGSGSASRSVSGTGSGGLSGRGSSSGKVSGNMQHDVAHLPSIPPSNVKLE